MGHQPYLFLALNAWFQKSDSNYIEGRLLWQNHLVDGACNLLWLASEQVIKILLLQKNDNQYPEEKLNLNDLHKTMNKIAERYRHRVQKLINKINNEYTELDISKYENTLTKLHEYFHRRYVVNSSSSIPLSLIEEVDEFYFLLRDKVHADVGPGTIDEIHIQKKHRWQHPVPAFKYAYINNNHFRPRKHREINLLLPDGSTLKENGE